MASRLRSFGSDASGVVAIEFAFIAPLLMLMTFGTFEISRALLMHKRFQKAASMVGDLVSREQQLGADPNSDTPQNPSGDAESYAQAKTELANMMKAAEHAMQPYSPDPLQIGVYQFRAKSDNAALTRIEWSYGYNEVPQPCSLNYGANSLVPANLLSKGDAAIIIDAKYKYTPLLANLLPGVIKQMTWSNTDTFSPRYGSVFYGQATQNTTCPPTD